ncbi:MAG TPA: hypothetical protein VGR26_04295 [Acidimicrobiales bacterium]|nr:hypothetical protein [Acidimicrobiales bacterium]
MKRTTVFGLAAVVLGLVATMAGAGARSEDRPLPRPEVEKVLIFSVPTLTWQSVLDERPPVLSALLKRSAVASLSVRTVGPRTSLAEGYVTVGAGNRASVAGDDDTPTATGEHVTGVVVTGLDALEEVNQAESFGARPGALGDALSRAGLSAGVVANADVGAAGGREWLHREATLAVMDLRGRIPAGTVSPALSIVDPSAPGGRIQDVAAATAAFSTTWNRAQVVLVEASDLARLDVVASASPEKKASPVARRAALARADELLGWVLEHVDLERHLVVVVAPTSGRAGGDGLTVAAFAGPGMAPGAATSASTNRSGYITLPDVAPTVLRALGLEKPDAMNGTPVVSSAGGGLSPSRLEQLAAANERAIFRDKATGPFSVAFIVFQLCTYALAVAALTWWPRLRPVVSFLALVTLAQPSLTFLSGLFRYDRLGVVGYVLALFAAGAVMASLVLAIARWSAGRSGRARPLVAPLLLVGLTLVVLVADILAGGPLQLNTVFGYSPIVAGRFAGYGNLAFALVSMAGLVVVTGGWAAAGLRRQGNSGRGVPPRKWLIIAAAVLSVVVVADGHPALGADVGGVLTLVPAGLVVLLLLRGRQVRWGHVVAIAGAAVAAMAGFAALDLARPPEERTHVGRFADQVLDGGAGVGTVLARKLDANLSLLFSSVWALIIPVALVFLAFLVRRGPSVVRQLEAALPGMRALLVGSLVLAVLGGGLNDSGVAVSAMMLAVLLPYVTVLALSLASRP